LRRPARGCGKVALPSKPCRCTEVNQTFLGEEKLLRSRGVAAQVLQNEECIQLMREFIEQNPELWNENTGVE
jgi:hypothetical protein